MSTGFRLCLFCLVLGLGWGCTQKPPAAEPPPPPPEPAPPSLTVVLLAEDDGSVGEVEVANPQGKQVLTREAEAVDVGEEGEPPGSAYSLPPGELDRLFGEALSAIPEAPRIFTLQFRRGTELTAESRQLIPDIVEAIRTRQSVDTSVVGHSDTSGDNSVNYRISNQRARAVADLLIAAGVDAGILEVASHGEDNLLIPTPDGVVEPRNRRVEVTVR